MRCLCCTVCKGLWFLGLSISYFSNTNTGRNTILKAVIVLTFFTIDLFCLWALTLYVLLVEVIRLSLVKEGIKVNYKQTLSKQDIYGLSDVLPVAYSYFGLKLLQKIEYIRKLVFASCTFLSWGRTALICRGQMELWIFSSATVEL